MLMVTVDEGVLLQHARHPRMGEIERFVLRGHQSANG